MAHVRKPSDGENRRPEKRMAHEILRAAMDDGRRPLPSALVKRPFRDKKPNPNVHIPLDEKTPPELLVQLEHLLEKAGGKKLAWSDYDPVAQLLLVEPQTLSITRPDIFVYYKALVDTDEKNPPKKVRMLTLPTELLSKALQLTEPSMKPSGPGGGRTA